ncbi:hypothetical protein K469DRAFT_609167, partial [Zopfia rhizophila CBS 207.26]
IKNIVSTAYALAIKEKYRIKFTYLSKAITVNKRFIYKFNKIENINSVFF